MQWYSGKFLCGEGIPFLPLQSPLILEVGPFNIAVRVYSEFTVGRSPGRIRILEEHFCTPETPSFLLLFGGRRSPAFPTDYTTG